MVEHMCNVSDNTYLKNSYPNLHLPTVIPPQPVASNVIAKGDTGASRHYLTQHDKHVLSKLINMQHGPRVGLPNRTTIEATQSEHLPLPPSLSATATKAHVFPGITSAPIISIGQ